MQALVFTAADRVELRCEPDPEPAGEQVVVQVRASGICGSELHGFRSVGMRKPPLIMGHEFAGTTADGTRVVINPLLSCGECVSCQRGNPQVCRRRELLGVSRPGGFAERVGVPLSCLHPLPLGLDWGAASLIEPLANGVHAWTLVADVPAQAAIIGAGPIGLVTALVARHAGTQVTLFETAPNRRRHAADLGFATAECLAEGDEYDVIVDAVGLPATRRAAITHLAPAGTTIWLGLAVDEATVGGSDIVRSEKRIIGSFAYRPADFNTAVALASSLDLSWTTAVPLSAAEETFYALAEGRSDIIKAVLTPDGPGP